MLSIVVRTRADEPRSGLHREEPRQRRPALRDYTNAVLFDDVWRRPGLSPRDRTLVTISALIAGGKATQLVGYLNKGLDNGLTRAEVAATITHLAFYAGWPNAMSAASVPRRCSRGGLADPTGRLMHGIVAVGGGVLHICRATNAPCCNHMAC